MTNTNVVVFTDPDGTTKRWHRISDRLVQMNRDYPLKDGYHVDVEKRDALSYQKGLLQLYEVRLKAGLSVDGSGLPSITDSSTIVMEASLRNQEGKVLASATSAKRILQEKDWEKLETNVRHRLLEVLGYPGELLDDDEGAGIKRLGDETTVNGTDTTKQDLRESSLPGLPDTAAEKKDVESVKASTAAIQIGKPGKVPRSILNQIDRLCNARGINPIPKFTEAGAALRYLAELTTTPGESTAVVNS